ncbi:MAG TPA: tRNA epoxyqueuosine(34) reductase QueG [Desulfitobacteriaceae bacterium]|nr:tRNA epoxyqueuosine(34) reductase QueG [Desulfitobacteriaceae bacterium]
MYNIILDKERLEWKEKIRRWAGGLGFIATGFTEARRNQELEAYLQKRRQKALNTPFEPEDSRLRSDPQAVWKECLTVVVSAYPLPLSRPPQNKQGILARSAVGEDYHLLVGRKLEILGRKMIANGWKTLPPKIQVDNGPLNERALAKKAGIGWLGRNQQLIVPAYGSFVALGLMLLDQSLPPDQILSGRCGECSNCIRACPVQILGEKPLAAQDCLSYLTQSKQILSTEQSAKLGGRLFGCDTCQEVCPHNEDRMRKENENLLPLPEKSSFSETALCNDDLQRGKDLMAVLNLSTREFDKHCRLTAAGWRGKSILQRNAYLALLRAGDSRLNKWLAERGDKNNLPQLLLPYMNHRPRS